MWGMRGTGNSIKKNNIYKYKKYLSLSRLEAQKNRRKIPAFHLGKKPVNSEMSPIHRQLLISRKQRMGHQQHTWPFAMR